MSEPTIAQQKKLIKTLKTPERFFKIDFGRYGGEVAMGSITQLVYCMRRGSATVIFCCAKKFATAGYPNPVQFHGSLNLSSAFRCGLAIHLMQRPISIPTSIQVIISVLISCVQIFSR